MPLTSKSYSMIRITIFAIGVMSLGTLPVQAASEMFCTAYANKALEQFKIGKEVGCKDLNYPVWSSDFNHHYNWCRTVLEADANKGGQQRIDMLEACGVTSSPASGIITSVGTVVDTNQATTRAVSPIPIPQPQNQDGGNVAALPIPMPMPALDPGLGDQTAIRAVSPIPIPMPAIDPGLGGQVPSFITIQNTAQRAKAAPSRGDLINALMANSATRSQLQALPNIGSNPQNLAHQTMGGTSSPSAQVLPQGLDWHAGIQFSPFAEPPTYFVGGKGTPLGSVEVKGANVSNQTVNLMNQEKVVILSNVALISLAVDLPNETATYMVAFALSAEHVKTAPYLYQGANAPIKAVAIGLRSQIPTPLTLVPLSGGKGFVAMIQVQGEPSFAPNEVLNEVFSLSFSQMGYGFVFGGITLTKL